MSAVPENLWPFKAVFSFGNNQKSHGAKSGKYGGWSNLIIDFWPKTPGQRARHEQGHCHDARFKHQAKVQVFSLQYFQITVVVHCSTLFKKLKVNNVLVIKKQMSIVFTWVVDMRAFFGLGDADVFHCMLWRFVSGSY
jgi:hypothetical protein